MLRKGKNYQYRTQDMERMLEDGQMGVKTTLGRAWNSLSHDVKTGKFLYERWRVKGRGRTWTNERSE